jgi:hypothetical protein
MRNYVSAEGVDISPHCETTMAPQLFELQLQDGAWGITASTVSHWGSRHGLESLPVSPKIVELLAGPSPIEDEQKHGIDRRRFTPDAADPAGHVPR